MSNKNKIIRKAIVDDVLVIHALINKYAKKRKLLPRSLSYIYDNLRDFFVYEDEQQIIGCSALHVVWEDLAEIKSLVVDEAYRGESLGTDLLEKCLEDAKALGVKRVFTLTYVSDFFKKNGFQDIDNKELPAKVWRECIECPFFPDCGEKALIINI